MFGFSLLEVGSASAVSADFVARIEGLGTMQESPAFQAFVSELLDCNPAAMLTLDLERCKYLDSTFLGCLVALSKRYSHGLSRRFVIAATPATRKRLLATTRLDRVLPLVEVFPPDVREWSAIPTTPVAARELGWHVMECHERLAETGCPQASAFQAIAEHLAHDLGQPVT